jgi:hypothetical protein
VQQQQPAPQPSAPSRPVAPVHSGVAPTRASVPDTSGSRCCTSSPRRAIAAAWRCRLDHRLCALAWLCFFFFEATPNGNIGRLRVNDISHEAARRENEQAHCTLLRCSTLTPLRVSVSAAAAVAVVSVSFLFRLEAFKRPKRSSLLRCAISLCSRPVGRPSPLPPIERVLCVLLPEWIRVAAAIARRRTATPSPRIGCPSGRSRSSSRALRQPAHSPPPPLTALPVHCCCHHRQIHCAHTTHAHTLTHPHRTLAAPPHSTHCSHVQLRFRRRHGRRTLARYKHKAIAQPPQPRGSSSHSDSSVRHDRLHALRVVQSLRSPAAVGCSASHAGAAAVSSLPTPTGRQFECCC